MNLDEFNYGDYEEDKVFERLKEINRKKVVCHLPEWKLIIDVKDFFVGKQRTVLVCQAIKYLKENYKLKILLFRKLSSQAPQFEPYDWQAYRKGKRDRIEAGELENFVASLGYEFIKNEAKNDKEYDLFWLRYSTPKLTPLRKGISLEKAEEMARASAISRRKKTTLLTMKKGEKELKELCSFSGKGEI